MATFHDYPREIFLTIWQPATHRWHGCVLPVSVQRTSSDGRLAEDHQWVAQTYRANYIKISSIKIVVVTDHRYTIYLFLTLSLSLSLFLSFSLRVTTSLNFIYFRRFSIFEPTPGNLIDRTMFFILLHHREEESSQSFPSRILDRILAREVVSSRLIPPCPPFISFPIYRSNGLSIFLSLIYFRTYVVAYQERIATLSLSRRRHQTRELSIARLFQTRVCFFVHPFLPVPLPLFLINRRKLFFSIDDSILHASPSTARPWPPPLIYLIASCLTI